MDVVVNRESRLIVDAGRVGPRHGSNRAGNREQDRPEREKTGGTNGLDGPRLVFDPW